MAVKSPSWQHETQTSNVSSGGVLFEADEEFSIGSIIEFVIMVPSKDLGTPSDVTINCVGRVVRCSAVGDHRAVAAVIDDYRFERCLKSN